MSSWICCEQTRNETQSPATATARHVQQRRELFPPKIVEHFGCSTGARSRNAPAALDLRPCPQVWNRPSCRSSMHGSLRRALFPAPAAFGTEHQQRHKEDDQQMGGLKQTFKHESSKPEPRP